jgi:predicted ester cyclase
MGAVELASKVWDLIEAKDTAAAAELLSDDFTFSGPVPEPINGEMWLGMHDRLNAAFPDWKFNISDVHPHGEVIHCTAQITGTHTGELDLSPLGLPVVPATGKSFQLPREEMGVAVVGDKITSISGESTPGGGVMGILSQLGVEVPH